MTIACAVHWYESLLFIAPVAMTVGVIWVMSRVERRREEREAAGETRPIEQVSLYSADRAAS